MSGVQPTLDYVPSEPGRPTPAPRTPPSSSRFDPPSSIDESRFTPGTILADRYRIVARIGRGGMGEVYRADDLKLGQSVALKFLPESLQSDPAALQRLLNEVRVARQIAHPNVCRVYDIDEVLVPAHIPERGASRPGAPGAEALAATPQHFISMELIDGEDLASLLRRIGRLPSDKAAQIAGQLCAGLAAAHERGVLHRDLKPANIMLDGRGHVRIMDFGLSGLAADFSSRAARAGTPAYMAPEQLTDGRVTARSDLYALGLVLYEVFTGRLAYDAGTSAELIRLHETQPPTSPSRFVPDIDRALERLILSCLERDPAERPASAASLLALLPGADPLAAAIAAGETPSPEVVAAAGEKGALSPLITAALLGALLVSIIVVAIVNDRYSMLARAHAVQSPPAVLAHRAGEIIASLGHSPEPLDRAWGFQTNLALVDYAAVLPRAERWAWIGQDSAPAACEFWYRQSADFMAPPRNMEATRITASEPPITDPGMVSLRLDVSGRLLTFVRVPVDGTGAAPDATAPAEPDWAPLFRAAGIDRAGLSQVTPDFPLNIAFDHRAAWRTTIGLPGDPEEHPVRIEAASFRGEPVFFRLVGPWTGRFVPPDPEKRRAEVRLDNFLILSILVPIVLLPCLGALWLARRNALAGRGDWRGATRVASVILVAQIVAFFTGSDLAAGPSEWDIGVSGVSGAMFYGLIVFVTYLAVEPYVRRRWPRTLVSWSRLLTGRWFDPLVGSDVLVGMAIGGGWLVVMMALALLAPVVGLDPARPRDIDYAMLAGVAPTISVLLNAGVNAVGWTLLLLAALLLLKGAIPWRWLSVVAFAGFAFMACFFLSNIIANNDTEMGRGDEIYITGPISAAIAITALIRLGLLPVVAAAFTGMVLFNAPVTLNFGAWYAQPWLISLLALAGIALWASRAAIGRRPARISRTSASLDSRLAGTR